MVRDPQRGVAKRLRLAGKVRDGVAGGIEPPVGSITPNCMGSPPLAPWAGVVAGMGRPADVGAEVRELRYARASASCPRRDARLRGRSPVA